MNILHQIQRTFFDERFNWQSGAEALKMMISSPIPCKNCIKLIQQMLKTMNEREQHRRALSARIALGAVELQKIGNKELKPGMHIEAFIQTDERMPLVTSLQPLTYQISRAFRKN